MKPVLQALVLAERVYTDVSGRKIIAGTFDRILFKTNAPTVQEVELPNGEKRRLVEGGQHGGSPYAYISFTDVVDGTKVVLQFVNLTRNLVLLEQQLTLNGKNRLETVEIVAPLPPLPVQEAGTYAFEVVCEGSILGSHRILAEELPDMQE